MSVTFKITQHSLHPDVTICEVWVDGRFVAAIYPDEPNGVKLLSNHVEGDEGNFHIVRFKP